MEHIGPSRKRQCRSGLGVWGTHVWEGRWKEYERCFFSPPQKYTVVREEREEKSRRERERENDYGFELCPLPHLIPILPPVLSVDPASLDISLGMCLMSTANTKLSQDVYKFKDSLSYIISIRPAWIIRSLLTRPSKKASHRNSTVVCDGRCLLSRCWRDRKVCTTRNKKDRDRVSLRTRGGSGILSRPWDPNVNVSSDEIRKSFLPFDNRRKVPVHLSD